MVFKKLFHYCFRGKELSMWYINKIVVLEIDNAQIATALKCDFEPMSDYFMLELKDGDKSTDIPVRCVFEYNPIGFYHPDRLITERYYFFTWTDLDIEIANHMELVETYHDIADMLFRMQGYREVIMPYTDKAKAQFVYDSLHQIHALDAFYNECRSLDKFEPRNLGNNSWILRYCVKTPPHPARMVQYADLWQSGAIFYISDDLICIQTCDLCRVIHVDSEFKKLVSKDLFINNKKLKSLC